VCVQWRHGRWISAEAWSVNHFAREFSISARRRRGGGLSVAFGECRCCVQWRRIATLRGLCSLVQANGLGSAEMVRGRGDGAGPLPSRDGLGIRFKTLTKNPKNLRNSEVRKDHRRFSEFPVASEGNQPTPIRGGSAWIQGGSAFEGRERFEGGAGRGPSGPQGTDLRGPLPSRRGRLAFLRRPLGSCAKV